MAVEFHNLGDLLWDPVLPLAVLERMSEQYAAVCVHPNNHAAVWSLPELDLPDALEVTYVRRTCLPNAGQSGNAPQHLMSPCCPDLPELAWPGHTT